MAEGDGEPFVIADYEQVRERFDLGSRDHARMRAKRRGWQLEPKNHPGAQTLVRVPRADWHAAGQTNRSPGTVRAVPEAQDSGVANVLADVLASVQQEREAAAGREAGLKQERDKAQAEAAELRGRAEQAAREREEARIQAARAEGAADELRHALQRAEDAAQAARAELAGWTSGGPLARAWRAFKDRRP